MQSQINPRRLFAFCKAAVVVLGPLGCLGLVTPANAALESGIYQTIPGATALEQGDNVPNGSRVVPLTASLTFDLAGAQPSLTAVIYDAVLEGGSPYADQWTDARQQPFELTVHSSLGTQLADGSYRFTGDYLRDIFPAGTQYLFDWHFSTASDGDVVWNGHTYWAGGHIWDEAISGITLVPEPGTLALMAAGVGILWAHRITRKHAREGFESGELRVKRGQQG